jgi:hypothetical protein
MAKWKKVVVSGSQAELNSLSLDTALGTGDGGTGLTALGTAGSDILGLDRGSSEQVLRVNTAGDGLEFADSADGDLTGIDQGAGIKITDGTTATPKVAVSASGNTLTVSDEGVKVSDGGITETQLNTSVAGKGIAGGGGTSLSLKLSELDEATVDVATDSFAFIDANDSDGTRKDTIADLIGAIDGNGLTATNGVLAVGNDGGTISVSSAGVKVPDAGITETQLNTTVAGTGLSGGGGTALSVDYGSAAGTAVQGDATATFTGTANQIKIGNENAQALGGNISATISLTDDVTISQDLIVSRNLTVRGTASFESTENLKVSDRFIALASGSGNAGDGGIVVEQSSVGGGKGAVFAYDGNSTERWGVTTGFNPTASAYEPDAFMSVAVVAADSDPDTNVADAYKKAGNIYVDTTGDGEAYIYV